MSAKQKGRLWLFSLALAMATLLAACQAQLPDWLTPWRSAANEEGIAPAGPATPNDGGPPLRLMAPPGAAGESSAFETALDQFQQAHPAVALTLTLPADYDSALTSALAGGAPPDIFVLDATRALALAAAGALAPLGSAFEQPDDLPPLLWTSFGLDGQLVCAPREMRTLALVYNRDRFDAAALAYPDAAWNWENLRSAAEALTNAETATVGLALPPDFSRWLPFLYGAGGSVTDAAMTAMTINSAEAATAMDFYVQLVIDGIAATPADLDTTWSGEALGKGKAAMAIEGNWVVPYLAESFPGAHFAAVELPTGPQSRATLAFATCYAIAAQTTQLATARQLVAYLVAEEQMAVLTASAGAMPTRISLLEPWRQAHPEGEAFVAGLGYARMWSFGPRFNPLITTVNNGLGQAFLSVRAVSDILAEADGVGNGILTRP